MSYVIFFSSESDLQKRNNTIKINLVTQGNFTSK